MRVKSGVGETTPTTPRNQTNQGVGERVAAERVMRNHTRSSRRGITMNRTAMNGVLVECWVRAFQGREVPAPTESTNRGS